MEYFMFSNIIMESVFMVELGVISKLQEYVLLMLNIGEICWIWKSIIFIFLLLLIRWIKEMKSTYVIVRYISEVHIDIIFTCTNITSSLQGLFINILQISTWHDNTPTSSVKVVVLHLPLIIKQYEHDPAVRKDLVAFINELLNM